MAAVQDCVPYEPHLVHWHTGYEYVDQNSAPPLILEARSHETGAAQLLAATLQVARLGADDNTAAYPQHHMRLAVDYLTGAPSYPYVYSLSFFRLISQMRLSAQGDATTARRAFDKANLQ